MKLLVCGGRDFDDRALFEREILNVGNKYGPIKLIIAGGARGADNMAIHLAKAWNIPYKIYSADWKKYKKGAGPIRNQRMLDEGKPDVVLAFPGGSGTADMMQRARKAGVTLVEILDKAL